MSKQGIGKSLPYAIPLAWENWLSFGGKRINSRPCIFFFLHINGIIVKLAGKCIYLVYLVKKRVPCRLICPLSSEAQRPIACNIHLSKCS